MITDVEFFTMKLSKIDGFGDAGDVLTDIAKTKEVEIEEPTLKASEEEKTEEGEGPDGSEESAKSSAKSSPGEADGEEKKAEKPETG